MAGISAQSFLYALLGGMVPTFLWLWFWLNEESEHKKPFGLIILTFIAGALGVLLLLPLKPVVEILHLDPKTLLVFYAGIEEVIKVVLVAIIAFGSSAITRATDYTIFLVTGALGFSALENTLYLLNPISQGVDLGTIIITGNLRFLGATVLHSISVAIVGVLIGIGFAINKSIRLFYAVVGIFIATGLHGVFNYFIMKDTRQSTLMAIAGIWIVAVIVILIFDRLRAYQDNIATYYKP